MFQGVQFRKVFDSLYQISYETQFEVCSTFFRVSQYYESSNKKIKNIPMSVMEGIYLYAKQYRKGKSPKLEFSYFSDWHGFNIHGKVFKRWMKEVKHLEPNEEQLRSLIIKNIPEDIYRSGNFYIIGTFRKGALNDINTLHHEVAHGMFALNETYRNEVIETLELYRKELNGTTWVLHKWDYADEVIDDELNAYLATSQNWFIKQEFPGDLLHIKKALRKIWKSYLPNNYRPKL